MMSAGLARRPRPGLRQGSLHRRAPRARPRRPSTSSTRRQVPSRFLFLDEVHGLDGTKLSAAQTAHARKRRSSRPSVEASIIGRPRNPQGRFVHPGGDGGDLRAACSSTSRRLAATSRCTSTPPALLEPTDARAGRARRESSRPSSSRLPFEASTGGALMADRRLRAGPVVVLRGDVRRGAGGAVAVRAAAASLERPGPRAAGRRMGVGGHLQSVGRQPPGIVGDALSGPGPERHVPPRLCTSSDGVRFTRRPEPVLSPEAEYERDGGVEDPRLTKIGEHLLPDVHRLQQEGCAARAGHIRRSDPLGSERRHHAGLQGHVERRVDQGGRDPSRDDRRQVLDVLHGYRPRQDRPDGPGVSSDLRIGPTPSTCPCCPAGPAGSTRELSSPDRRRF